MKKVAQNMQIIEFSNLILFINKILEDNNWLK